MKIFVLCVLAFFLVGCKMKSIEIPFSYTPENYIMPHIKLNFSENKFFAVLGIDTGSEDNHFTNSNILYKLFGSEEAFEDAVKKSGIDITNMKESYVLSFNFKDVQSGNVIFSEINILDSSNYCEDKKLDGVIGYKTFEKYNVMVLDFRRNVLKLGERIVNGELLPLMYKKIYFNDKENFTTLLETEVEIDGVKKYVLLDTGCSTGGEPIIMCSKSSKMPKVVSVKIGQFLYKNVECVQLSKGEFADKTTLDIINNEMDIFVLGNAFFQNHRIQLDFENMTFAMD